MKNRRIYNSETKILPPIAASSLMQTKAMSGASGRASKVSTCKPQPHKPFGKTATANSGNWQLNQKVDNRLSKNRLSPLLDSDDNWEKSTYYVRDAQGNVMSVYEHTVEEAEESFVQKEKHIYGSSRIGMEISETEMISATVEDEDMVYYIGNKQYELSNHLGNVLAVITDKKIPIESTVTSGEVGYYEPEIVTAMDYSPFGVVLEDRKFESTSYRYGFNGMEKDDEVKGSGNSYDFGARMHDPRLGRFFTPDPKESKYPWQSTYVFAANCPIIFTDVNGEGPGKPNTPGAIIITNVVGSGTTPYTNGWNNKTYPIGSYTIQSGTAPKSGVIVIHTVQAKYLNGVTNFQQKETIIRLQRRTLQVNQLPKTGIDLTYVSSGGYKEKPMDKAQALFDDFLSENSKNEFGAPVLGNNERFKQVDITFNVSAENFATITKDSYSMRSALTKMMKNAYGNDVVVNFSYIQIGEGETEEIGVTPYVETFEWEAAFPIDEKYIEMIEGIENLEPHKTVEKDED